jgi:predicted alpha/beta-hydrolase family hydrolase
MQGPQPRKLDVGPLGAVSALWWGPPEAIACFVFAHGAGAGMAHPFMEAVATGLFERKIATLRYQWKNVMVGPMLQAEHT